MCDRIFAFAWIAGIAEIAGKPENEFATGTRTTWLLLVIFTGIIGLVVYVLVGKKRDWTMAATPPSKIPSAQATPTAAALTAPPTPSTSSAPADVPETKKCPDCAEEIRFAARKCRFCG